HTTLDSPAYRKINASLMGLLFLLTGDNYQNIVPDNTKAKVERRNTQKSGVILYLNEKIAKLSEEKRVLEEKIATNHNTDIENKLDETISAIENVENEIASSSAESRSILERVYDMSARLEEARFLNDRYILLQSQYDSDIQRLEFMLDGEKKLSDYEPLTRCPFCDSDIKNPFAKISYVSAATAEINKIKSQKQDLEDAASDIQNEIKNLEDEINDLNQRNDIIVEQISSQLTPLASNLREQVKSYKEIVEAKRRIYSLEAMTAELNTDAYNAEETEDEKVQHFSAKDFFDKNLWEYISNNFGKAVKACAYPNFTTARMNIKTADAVVNGKPKKSEGKGYRAFLNTLVLFNMMKVLEERAKYSLRMLVLDSPILSLKEKDMKESEKTTQGMKESLFKYIIKNCGENQMIIVENELPDGVDYSNANLIEFTMDDVIGRYGFMHTLKAEETL
ncbi:MAG: hypothetical protein LUC41_00515, partial [Clostridiales bacterium]|nr:hypothetical protein [Clostridiales bacterium]